MYEPDEVRAAIKFGVAKSIIRNLPLAVVAVFLVRAQGASALGGLVAFTTIFGLATAYDMTELVLAVNYLKGELRRQETPSNVVELRPQGWEGPPSAG